MARPSIRVRPPLASAPAAERRLQTAWLLITLTGAILLLGFAGMRLGGLAGSKTTFQLQVLRISHSPLVPMKRWYAQVTRGPLPFPAVSICSSDAEGPAWNGSMLRAKRALDESKVELLGP